MPILSSLSSVARIPAVSTKRKRMPSITTLSSIVSRVVPAISDTIARSSPTRRFSRVLLPTFGAPIMATDTPLRMAFPVRKESLRLLTTAIVWLSILLRRVRSANSTSSSPKSSSSSRSAVSSISLSLKSLSVSEYPPRICVEASVCAAFESAAIISATASACDRSMRPAAKARAENSPGSATLAPCLHSREITLEAIYREPWIEISTLSSPVYECGARKRATTTSSTTCSPSIMLP